MEDLAKAHRWATRYFVLVSIVVFGTTYIGWFRLTPLMFYNDPDYAFLAGLILLGLYALFATLTKLTKNHQILQAVLFIPSAILFVGNILHVFAFFPSLEFTTNCNGKTYYITWMHPFGDYQWTFNNVTIWESPFKYDSFFFGYSGGGYRIVCDSERSEANIINTSRDILVYTDAKSAVRYDEYNGAQFKNYRYFLARQCNDWASSTCGSVTYTLYQCNLNFKSCDPLRIQYTQYETRDFLELRADEITNQINLYEEDFDTNEVVPIFTYSENPHCYVEGCKILEKTK